ncbi:hypothetical protein VOLCADRAFT_99823 [Volvox carteri f. nagariensis]|uniref:Uncharacterized protein n=1 Tax=Volvox carteri f. nagariensis TaxID=3068 RepID=D8UIR5_VOLCA|nr:uncharacterized protein VOLCADRAFT_99823 [Volvox carteri f. nagariensis]EFJ40384.1 hypothetical protein VOLCADRAFT_99823 [Volvox carteri f. nagariensis]|eukprot:XP_002958535.1 hypothetical protein VOLCADRAFT_99823 [Volvox carteri f. nagariensis]
MQVQPTQMTHKGVVIRSANKSTDTDLLGHDAWVARVEHNDHNTLDGCLSVIEFHSGSLRHLRLSEPSACMGPTATGGVSVSPSAHGFTAGGHANLWAEAASGSNSTSDRQQGSLAAVAGPGAPPGPMSAPPSSNRHKRSASIDVSSLIATRDGIGPAKDYLAPAASQSPAAASHAPQGHLSPERRSPLARDGGTGTGTGTGNFMMGHKTAPPALEALRQNHPGMSLAQAVRDYGVVDGCRS